MAVTNGVNKDTVAVIAGALAAMGIGFSRIKAIRPAARQGGCPEKILIIFDTRGALINGNF